MANDTTDTFMNDTSGDIHLTCSLCNKIFNNPYCTPCDHTFCQECIKQETRTTCPTCEQTIAIDDLRPATRIIVDMIDRDRVICNHCGEKGILRENFNDHIKNTCEKTLVKCPAEDIQCLWKGSRDEIDQHLLVCSFNSIRSMILQLRRENQQLKQQINTFQDHCEEQNQQRYRDIQTMKDNQSISNCEFHEQLQNKERKITEQQTTIINLTNQMKKLTLEIEILRFQLNNCSAEKDTIAQSRLEQENQIEQLTKKLNIMAGLIGYYNSELIEHISQCDQRMMQLNEKKLTDQDMFIIVQYAMINKQYQALDLQSNEITDEGIAILADALPKNTFLKILLLYNNRLSDVGVSYLTQALSTNSTLEILELQSNGITDIGATYLAQMLRNNSTLTSLYLTNNQIGDCGIQSLAETLANYNSTLSELILDKNKSITDASVDVLVAMLKSNSSLSVLRLWDCNISEIGKAKLQEKAMTKEGFTLIV